MKQHEKDLLNETTNPFSASLVIKTRTITTVKKVVDISRIENGIILSLPDSLTSQIVLEDEKFTKVYNRAGYRLHISALNLTTKSLFLWLLYEIEEGQDWLWLNRNRYKLENGGTWVDLNKSIEELTQNSVITPTIVKDCYWLNPLFFFNGNRLKKYPNSVV